MVGYAVFLYLSARFGSNARLGFRSTTKGLRIDDILCGDLFLRVRNVLLLALHTSTC